MLKWSPFRDDLDSRVWHSLTTERAERLCWVSGFVRNESSLSAVRSLSITLCGYGCDLLAIGEQVLAF